VTPHGVLARLRSWWRGVRRRDGVETEMSEEFRAHIELRADDLARAGLAREEALRQARLEFGSTERYKEQGVAERGLKRYDDVRISWLDFKLGFRMLAKYPGLTIVGGLAIAFAIAAGAGAFEFINQMLSPKLAFENGERFVAIRVWDAATSRVEQRTLHDFARWQKSLRSIEELGAFRTVNRNLITADGSLGEPVIVAEVTSSAFRITNARAALGRTLQASDEAPGAAPVAVIGHDTWKTRFAGAAGVIGQTVRLGKTQATIVGVMPEGFKFPIYHTVWVPFRSRAVEYGTDAGPVITKIFGRLAPGRTFEQAQAELSAVGIAPAVGDAKARASLKAVVLPYAQSFMMLSGGESMMVRSINVFLVMLLVLVCSNVALLMFARAASREGEIVVRTALGASRSRIITQLFAEALVLGVLGAVVGLTAANKALGWTMLMMQGTQDGLLPFWYKDHLSSATYLYAGGLTLLGAAIAGVLPALKVTRGLESRLRQAAAGGGGLRFGGVWTAVIVAQVAVTVAFPVSAFFTRRDAVQMESLPAGFDDREYLSAHIAMDRDALPGTDTSAAAFAARGKALAGELSRRLGEDPAVAGVAFASVLPRMDHNQQRIEVDEGGSAPVDSANGIRVSSASVSPNYFDVVDAPMSAGRGFHAGDLDSGSNVAIANETFVRQVLGGRNPIGRRIRVAARRDPEAAGTKEAEPGPWLEIVGVVKDLAMTDGTDPRESGAGFYQPMAPGSALPSYMAVHLRGDPTTFAPRLRAVVTAVDPTLRLDRIVAVNDIQKENLESIAFWFRLLLIVSGVALLLSLAGIYAVMSFTVSRRTREIGIRLALGSDRRRIMTAIFAQPSRQVGIGIAVGGVLAGTLSRMILESMSLGEMAVVVAYATIMMGVCLLAAIVPTRRALGIQPTEALRSE
jgi:predicted permease